MPKTQKLFYKQIYMFLKKKLLIEVIRIFFITHSHHLTHRDASTRLCRTFCLQRVELAQAGSFKGLL